MTLEQSTLLRLSNLEWANAPKYPFDIMRTWMIVEPRQQMIRALPSGQSWRDAAIRLWGGLCFLCPSTEGEEWQALMQVNTAWS